MPDAVTKPPEVPLKDRRLAALLAWLVPGLGHLYQGRIAKGLLYAICILGTFYYGLYLGEGRVVYVATDPVLEQGVMNGIANHWKYICQIGAGLPALPAMVQRMRVMDGKPPLGIRMAPPGKEPIESQDPYGNRVRHPNELAKWQYEMGHWFELGSIYTVIAGLLNIIAAFDAYAGPLVIPVPVKKKTDKAEEIPATA